MYQNMYHYLLLKVDGLYLIVHNLDTSDGLTNGVPCTVKHFSLTPAGIPFIAWVIFEDKQIGIKQ